MSGSSTLSHLGPKTPLLSPSGKEHRTGSTRFATVLRILLRLAVLFALALVGLGIVILDNLIGAQPNTLWGVSYNPALEGRWCPTPEQILKDLSLIAPMTKRLRLYESGCQLDTILSTIEDNRAVLGDFQLFVSVVLSHNSVKNQGSISELISTIEKYRGRHVEMIAVGNEVLFRKTLQETELIAMIRRVRTELHRLRLDRIRVVTADVFASYMGSASLTDEVDAIVANLHPYFDDEVGAEHAADVTFDQLFQLQALQGKRKPVIIGETGWPSAGNGDRTTPALYNIYLKSFVCRARSYNVQFYWFEAFDSMWKTNVDDIEHHWGLFNKDRTQKKIDYPPFRSCV